MNSSKRLNFFLVFFSIFCSSYLSVRQLPKVLNFKLPFISGHKIGCHSSKNRWYPETNHDKRSPDYPQLLVVNTSALLLLHQIKQNSSFVVSSEFGFLMISHSWELSVRWPAQLTLHLTVISAWLSKKKYV